jgi:hypothetical protein
MRTWEHIKLEELPWHNSLGFFYLGGRGGVCVRSLIIHVEIKRELFMILSSFKLDMVLPTKTYPKTDFLFLFISILPQMKYDHLSQLHAN